MQLIESKYYPGKNVYCFQPVIKGKISLGQWTGMYSDELGDFSDRLIALLPGLAGHHCSRGFPGGFLERIKEGTYLGHVVEHIALELLNLAGLKVNYGKTLATSQPEIYEVIVESPVGEAGVAALQYACLLVQQLLHRQSVEVEQLVKRVRRQIRQGDLGPSTKAIVEAAKSRGIPVIRLNNRSLVQLGYGKYLKRIQAALTDLSSSVAVDISCDKALTKELLTEAGLPVPRGALVNNLVDAKAITQEIGFPVAIKPQDGNQGRGVCLNLNNLGEVERAIILAQEVNPNFIVEKYIPGRHYRGLVIGKKLVAVAERFPAFVIGNGRQNIWELIEQANAHPWRGEEHEKPLTKIVVDSRVLGCLAKQGLTVENIPAEGRQIFLRENANLSTGGVAVDVTEQVCPENRELLERAIRIIGLDVAGVDFVAEDVCLPIHQSSGAIIEINATPGLRMHQFPLQGLARPVGEAIVDWLFPPGTPTRIPIVAVTGTNGKTTTSRMISSILKLQGKMVGLTTSDGIYIGEAQVMKGDTTGPRSAQVVLGDSAVEVAVLETARGGILRAGLGYGESDVAVITNITGDHIGQDGIESLEELAHVKALVGEVVLPGGYVVVNGDDPVSVGLIDRFLGQVIFFTRTPNNHVVKRHLGAGGWGVLEKQGEIIFAKGDRAKVIMKTREIPATYGGLAGHNVENALAAIGAGCALGVDVQTIARALANFGCNLQQNPGRMNLIPIGEVQVLLDYGHNPQGFERVMETLKKIHQGRIIGVVGMPGDRRNGDIFRAGEVLAQGLNRIIIKEDTDLRGRAASEVAGILRAGALSMGLSPEAISLNLNEAQAIAQALREAAPGDLVVIFYEKLSGVLPVLEAAIRNTPVRSEPDVGADEYLAGPA
ncbi:MAG: cyanophycin synthetase [Carboxydocellales bacterium]